MNRYDNGTGTTPPILFPVLFDLTVHRHLDFEIGVRSRGTLVRIMYCC